MAERTLRDIGLVLPDGREAYVFWDEGWEAYGWTIENDFTNGPFDSHDEAVGALADELQERGYDLPPASSWEDLT